MKKQKSEILQNIRYVVGSSFHMDKGLWVMIASLALINAVYSLLPGYFSKIIIEIITKEETVNALFGAGVMIAVILLIVFGSRNYINQMLWWRMAKSRLGFMCDRIDAAEKVPYAFFEEPEKLDIMKRADKATDGSYNGIQGMLWAMQSLTEYGVKFILAFLLLSYRNAWLILVVLLIQYVNVRRLSNMRKVNKEKTLDAMAPIERREEYLSNVMKDYTYGKDIRMFGLQGWLTGKYRTANEKLHSLVKESNFRFMRCDVISNALNLLQDGIIYGWLVVCLLQSGITIAEFVLYARTMAVFSASINSFFDSISDIRYASSEVSDFRAFMNLAQENADCEKRESISKSGELEFSFEKVFFHYPGQEKDALQDINIRIPQGETLGIVGLNGAGKSTFIKLLCGLYDVTTGMIMLNGIDIRKYHRREYFQLFSPVFQDGQIYAFTCGENIRMGQEKKHDGVMKKVLEESGVTEFTDKLPKGLDTDIYKVISEDGVDLSGGEKQKLIFARALYKNAPVLLLDEPTAAYDALSEQRFFQKFQKMREGKTCIYITHRLSSASLCDKIAVFKDGGIAEYGTPSDLLLQNGEFAKLYRLQNDSFRLEEGDFSNETD